jgi:hypothetical protein
VVLARFALPLAPELFALWGGRSADHAEVRGLPEEGRLDRTAPGPETHRLVSNVERPEGREQRSESHGRGPVAPVAAAKGNGPAVEMLTVSYL